MQLQTYWKHPRHRCGQCRGLFLGEENFVETLGSATLESVAASDGGFIETATGPVASLPEGEPRCPRDATRMRVLCYKGVEIDICLSCRSVWLDDGEFAKISALAPKEIDPSGRRGAKVDATGALDVVDFVGEALGTLFDGLGFL